MSFSELQLAPSILKAIGECGYAAPTPIQALATICQPKVVSTRLRPALPKAFPNVGHVALGVGLVGGFAHACGIDNEAPRLAVLKEAASEDRIVAVRPSHRRGEVVRLLCPTGLCGGHERDALS